MSDTTILQNSTHVINNEAYYHRRNPSCLCKIIAEYFESFVGLLQ